MTGCLNH